MLADRVPSTSVYVGRTIQIVRRITDADAALLALITDNQNPAHIDDTIAENSILGQRIVPVSLLTGLIEAAIPQLITEQLCSAQAIVCEIITQIGLEHDVTVFLNCVGQISNSLLQAEFTVTSDSETIAAKGTVEIKIIGS